MPYSGRGKSSSSAAGLQARLFDVTSGTGRKTALAMSSGSNSLVIGSPALQ